MLRTDIKNLHGQEKRNRAAAARKARLPDATQRAYEKQMKSIRASRPRPWSGQRDEVIAPWADPKNWKKAGKAVGKAAGRVERKLNPFD